MLIILSDLKKKREKIKNSSAFLSIASIVCAFVVQMRELSSQMDQFRKTNNFINSKLTNQKNYTDLHDMLH